MNACLGDTAALGAESDCGPNRETTLHARAIGSEYDPFGNRARMPALPGCTGSKLCNLSAVRGGGPVAVKLNSPPPPPPLPRIEEVMKVVVVESPAKAKNIGSYLGSDYRVVASYGHVRDLREKSDSVVPGRRFPYGLGGRPGCGQTTARNRELASRGGWACSRNRS